MFLVTPILGTHDIFPVRGSGSYVYILCSVSAAFGFICLPKSLDQNAFQTTEYYSCRGEYDQLVCRYLSYCYLIRLKLNPRPLNGSTALNQENCTCRHACSLEERRLLTCNPHCRPDEPSILESCSRKPHMKYKCCSYVRFETIRSSKPMRCTEAALKCCVPGIYLLAAKWERQAARNPKKQLSAIVSIDKGIPI